MAKKITKKKVTKKKTTKKVAVEKPIEPIQDDTQDRGLPVELKRLKALTKEQIQALLASYLDCNILELQQAKRNPNTSSMELIVIGIITKAIKDGDPKRLDFLLDRIVGKVKNELEVTGNIHDKLMSMIESKTKA